ncbi:hypothetical protein ALC60_02367 [Trachymyrmex zeteki]|uniref:Uncharacterized protein n=1 Tax=Mycetomoellerius zeteki TaxID=64791 RepID=A0A151XED6_9HYME|nr:hypothetical protein ALC60_02367 [Trachymyrmex zeteki]
MHRRTSGLTKSDDFSNARVVGAIVSDYERRWTTDNVPRIPRIILHADGGFCRPGPSDESWNNDKRGNRNANTTRDSVLGVFLRRLHSLHRPRFSHSLSIGHHTYKNFSRNRKIASKSTNHDQNYDLAFKNARL